MDAQNHLSLKYISLVEAGTKIEGTFMVDLVIMHTEVVHHSIKILEVDIGITLIAEGILVTILEVVRGIGIITMVTEETIIEVKAMIGTEVDRQDKSRGRDRSMSNSRSRSGSRASTNRDRIRCFECREYDHFVRECPTK